MDDKLSAWAYRQRTEYKNGTLSQEKIELLNSIGFNWETGLGNVSLAESNPVLAAEWHPTKNGTLIPADVSPGSNKKVWWRCKKGHEWYATIKSRYNGNGCPVCANRVVQPGYNDFGTIRPDLAAEWHPVKNGTLTPADVLPRSQKIVWWLCEKGHEWKSSIANRSNGRGCPVCANKAILPGYNDLGTIRPDIAAEWHPAKNGTLTPADVLPGSNKKVWWLCEKGHEWKSSIVNRFKGTGCPYCSGRYAISGVNDLATLRPDIAVEWHPVKNGTLTPADVLPRSQKIVWWLCEKGHEWQASVANRSNGNGCPYCSGRYAIPGVNDLATLRPDLAAEWHPTKNGSLTPADVSPGSEKKAWWLCEKGHEWQAFVFNRSRGNGCPVCTNRVVLLGYNDLGTIRPDLAAEWHPTKNGTLTPAEVTPGSNKKVWWLCEKGHEWQAKIVNRNHRNGCPICNQIKQEENNG